MTTMRALGLNHFASGQARRHAAATALLLLALAGNIAGGLYYAHLSEQRESIRDLAARSASRRGMPGPLTGADRRAADELQTELARASDAVRALNVPWDALFAAIEAASSPDISLLAFDPTPAKKKFTLQAEARNMDAVLVYLHALSDQPAFAAVSLQSHQVQQTDPRRPVRILVLVEWRARS